MAFLSGVRCSYRCHHKSCRTAEGLRFGTNRRSFTQGVLGRGRLSTCTAMLGMRLHTVASVGYSFRLNLRHTRPHLPMNSSPLSCLSSAHSAGLTQTMVDARCKSRKRQGTCSLCRENGAMQYLTSIRVWVWLQSLTQCTAGQGIWVLHHRVRVRGMVIWVRVRIQSFVRCVQDQVQ
jgi:hypothetical protein